MISAPYIGGQWNVCLISAHGTLVEKGCTTQCGEVGFRKGRRFTSSNHRRINGFYHKINWACEFSSGMAARSCHRIAPQ